MGSPDQVLPVRNYNLADGTLPRKNNATWVPMEGLNGTLAMNYCSSAGNNGAAGPRPSHCRLCYVQILPPIEGTCIRNVCIRDGSPVFIERNGATMIAQCGYRHERP